MKKLSNSELKGEGFLNDLKSQGNPFSVPEDYFHNLTNEIIQRKNIIESTEKALLIPPNYPAELTDDILLRIKEEQLKSIVNHDGFTVPTQYFEQLQTTILSKTARKDSKIIPIQKSRRSWLRYASAASIALATSLFAFFQLSEKQGTSEVVQVEDIIDEVPAEDIISYLAFYSETGDYIILSEEFTEQSGDIKDSFSSEEIESYLENSI